jgi:large subunit ribosomal protein L1
MPKHGKKYLKSAEGVDRARTYTIQEALSMAKNGAFAKFDETVELAVRLGVDPKHSDQQVRGSIVMPNGTGRSVRILVFAKGEKVTEALAAGADVAGGDELVDKVAGGWMEFDSVVATPDMMGSVRKLGKTLGPRGLMPNPKTGTLTFEVGQAVKELKAGKVEYRTDKGGVVHALVGKVSMTEQALQSNALTLLGAIIRAKPESAKGQYLRAITISSTMGPGVKVDVGQAQMAATAE